MPHTDPTPMFGLPGGAAHPGCASAVRPGWSRRIRAFHLGLAAALAALPALPAIALPGLASDGCITSLAGLGATDAVLWNFSWRETTMTDGKPLTLILSERDGLLHLDFHKAGEGLWATGNARICRRGSTLEVRLSHALTGPAAPWLLRQTMGATPEFLLTRLGAAELQVTTRGWSGRFVAMQ